MSDTSTDVKETLEETSSPPSEGEPGGFEIGERLDEVVGKVNEFLGKVDWDQAAKFGKGAGIILAVIVAQILIKGVLDTINLLPVVPGLLELLGLVIVGKWSWENLTTSEKRSAVMDRVQSIKKEYLG
jgi:hypothetical protein